MCSHHGNWLSSTCSVTCMLSGKTLNLIDENMHMQRITYSLQRWSGIFIRSLLLFMLVRDSALQLQ